MSEPIAEVYLNPETEGARLWHGAQEAFQKAGQDVVNLCAAVELGVRVAEITTAHCLQKVRHEFPASVATLLEAPPPEVDAERDFLHPPKSLRFIDVVDLLSDEDLPCISPQLHHGWEDRMRSCRRSRARTKKATNFSLNAKQRGALTLIGAYRNRIFVLPPPVRVVPGEVVGAYATLVELVERLFDSAKVSAD